MSIDEQLRHMESELERLSRQPDVEMDVLLTVLDEVSIARKRMRELMRKVDQFIPLRVLFP